MGTKYYGGQFYDFGKGTALCLRKTGLMNIKWLSKEPVFCAQDRLTHSAIAHMVVMPS